MQCRNDGCLQQLPAAINTWFRTSVHYVAGVQELQASRNVQKTQHGGRLQGQQL